MASFAPTLAPPSPPARTTSPAALPTALEAPGVFTEVLTSPRELARHSTAWATLAQNALEPNSFYEPWMFLPALEAFSRGKDLRFLLVWRRAPGKAEPMLIGFFPLEQRRLKGTPLRCLALWRHMHCFLCTPLLHKEHAREALEAFLDWPRAAKAPRVLYLDLVSADGPFQQVLVDVLFEAGHVTFVDEVYNRAVMRRGEGGQQYIDAHVASGNRKELRRQRRRLAEQGQLDVRVLSRAEEVEDWVGKFLDLEAAGWKGAEGTALGSDAVQREYFTRIAQAGFAAGKLQMLGLFLNDRPIALKCNFVSVPGAFAFKIAFDETLSRCSPGVQLELENILLAHQQPGLQWMDSCAVSRHFMINRLWGERRTIQHLWISTGGWLADLAVGALPWLRALRRFGRRKG